MSFVVMLGQLYVIIPVSKESVSLLFQEKQGIKVISLDSGVSAFISQQKYKGVFHIII